MNEIGWRVKLEDAIKKIFEKNNQEFFSYAWRENVDQFLETESRYDTLVKWINDRITFELNIISTFNPADRDDAYKVGYLKQYLSACETVSVLTNAREIILDRHCTSKMRENWEYTLCKLYNLYYCKDLNQYLKADKKNEIKTS